MTTRTHIPMVLLMVSRGITLWPLLLLWHSLCRPPHSWQSGRKTVKPPQHWHTRSCRKPSPLSCSGPYIVCVCKSRVFVEPLCLPSILQYIHEMDPESIVHVYIHNPLKHCGTSSSSPLSTHENAKMFLGVSPGSL